MADRSSGARLNAPARQVTLRPMRTGHILASTRHPTAMSISSRTGTAMQLARESKNRNLLDYAVALQERHEKGTSADARKEKGQVFTPPSLCRFMASLITQVPDRFRLLDPGA